jgi:hypothetical protein
VEIILRVELAIPLAPYNGCDLDSTKDVKDVDKDKELKNS